MRIAVRSATAALAVAVSLVWPAGAAALNDLVIIVGCASGESIGRALSRPTVVDRRMVVVVSGTCTENVVIERDEVTLQGEPGAGVVAADPALPTISLLGARRIVITSLAVSGGSDGISANRGSGLDVSACTLQGNSRFGLVVSYNGTATLDNCTIQNNGNHGAVAANGAQLVVTNSTVQNNAGNGLVGTRNSHLRVGQDANGGSTPGPVTIRSNGQNGVGITDSAAAIVIGGVIENNAGNGVAVGGSSSAMIGIGSFNVTAPVTIRGNNSNGVNIDQGSRGLVQDCSVENNGRTGVRIHGAAGTVIGSHIHGNGQYGVASLNGSSALIGLADNNTPSGNLIENNFLEGVHVVGASSAWMFGNTIQGNSLTNGRYGVLAVENSALRFIGLNTIQNNGSIVGGVIGGGIFLRASGLFMQKGDFNVTPNTNSVQNNTGDGIQAVENSTIDLRDGVLVNGNTADGIRLIHGVRLRAQATTISGNTTAGIRLQLGSTARFGPAPNTLVDAIVCTDIESSVSGALAPGCTGF